MQPRLLNKITLIKSYLQPKQRNLFQSISNLKKIAFLLLQYTLPKVNQFNLSQQMKDYIMYDEQQQLLNRQTHKIEVQKYKTNTKPYLLSSFNQKFDSTLKQLVIQYEFEFDRIALHLHYLFPVYQQKITSRTVAVRWWQLQMETKMESYQLNRIQQSKESNNKLKDQENNMMQKDQNNNRQENSTNNSIICVDNNNSFLNSNRVLNTLSILSYSQAMQQSLILQEQQSDRLIMYKPKFIIDSQYKLQRYEMFENNKNNKNNYQDNSQQDDKQLKSINNNGNQSMKIQQILSRVVNNEFVYDQFGGFNIGSIGQKLINAQKIHSQQQQQLILNSKQKQKWWVKQLQVDSDSQQSFQEELILSNNTFNQHKHQQNNQIHQQSNQIVNFMENNFLQLQIQSNSFDNPQKQVNIINNQSQKQQVYQLNQNWDQYQSD